MKLSAIVAAAFASALSFSAQAAVGVIADAAVTATIVAGNGEYGGCAARLSVNVNTSVPATNCPGNIVTFSCDAAAPATAFTSKDMAFHLFDQAQFAKAAGKKVALTVDDSKKHSTYCFARRIEVK